MRPTPDVRPLVLCVLDGWGHREECESNAVCLAKTPVFDRLWADSPHSLIEASDKQDALAKAKGCPILAAGGSIEVAEAIDM